MLVGEPSKAASQAEKEGEDKKDYKQYHRDVVHRPDQNDIYGEDDDEDNVDGEHD